MNSPKHRPTSVVIAEVAEHCADDGVITVGELLEQMGNKALALAILVFAIAAVIAGIIPGFSTLVAMPIMFIALQLVLGNSTIRLPKRISEKEISPKVVRGALAQSMPTIRKVEKLMRPRITVLTGGIFLRLVAIIIIFLAGILAMPIPGGNFLPSFTIALLSLAIIERDGIFLLLTLCTLFFTGKLMINLIEKAYGLISLWIA